jgi:hypothetical protein
VGAASDIGAILSRRCGALWKKEAFERCYGDGMDRVGQAIAVLFAASAIALSGCGSTTQLPEVHTSAPLTSATVGVTQTGNATATIDKSSLKFMLDTIGALVVRFNLTSNAAHAQTLTVRGSLFDSSGTIVGDVTGGAVGVTPGAAVAIQLNGPAPNGTISSITLEVTQMAAP